jgi:hypothetical protein
MEWDRLTVSVVSLDPPRHSTQAGNGGIPPPADPTFLQPTWRQASLPAVEPGILPGGQNDPLAGACCE